MYPYEAARGKPLVIILCYDRFDLLRMTLPRIVNATRRIGGYLWAIDDGSNDDRVQRKVLDYQEKGYIDWVTLGNVNRCGDFIGVQTARRLVAIRHLYRKKVPMAFMVESDMLIHPATLEAMLKVACYIKDAGYKVSAISGTQGNPSIFTNARWDGLKGFQLIFHGPYLAQGLVLIPFSQIDLVEKIVPWDEKKEDDVPIDHLNREGTRFSLNRYVSRAVRAELESCHIFDMPTQHLGIGLAGGTSPGKNFFNVNWTDDSLTKLMQVPGFDVDGFREAVDGTDWSLMEFANLDEKYFYHNETKTRRGRERIIEEPSIVSPWFYEFIEKWKY